MKKAIKESFIYLLLGLLARYLLKVFRPVLGVAYTVIRITITPWLGWHDLRQCFEDIAVTEDQSANVYLKHFLNDTMIEADSLSKFGYPDETLSSVYGKNFRDKSLLWFGKMWRWFLDFVDTNHVTKSIEEDEGIPKI
jgi:hypothetical protein